MRDPGRLDDIINHLASITPESIEKTNKWYIEILEALLQIENSSVRGRLRQAISNERSKTKLLIETREELIEFRQGETRKEES